MREGSEYLVLPNPPLTIEASKRKLQLAGRTLEVDVNARAFDHGAMSVIVEVPVDSGTSVEALIPIADELYDQYLNELRNEGLLP